MYLNITSSNKELDEAFIHNFTHINILEELRRIKGVAFIDIMGEREYAIRIWLKPDRMAAYKVSADEVLEALEEQNIEAAPGKIGESSMKESQSVQYILNYKGRFNDEVEYEQIPIKATADGQILRIKDIADVEFGTSYYDVFAKENGEPSAAIMIKQLPGSNAKMVIDLIKEKMEEIKKTTFLEGMDYTIGYDVSSFLDASMAKVIHTFIEAFLLVSLVVLIFLGDLRSAIIPTLAVPVSLIGTFFFMQMFGFTINLITMFALVLAIGIVIDDAIVVVEAVHLEMKKSGSDAKTATLITMGKIAKPIISITLVMAAVFVPIAFMSGPVGVFFRQFSVTLAISIILSGVVALTLTPALCALILKNEVEKDSKSIFKRFHNAFIGRYDKLSQKYRKVIGVIVNRRTVTYTTLIVFLFATFGFSWLVPTGFIPNEDQGVLYANILTPAGSTIERTQKVVDEVQTIANEYGFVKSVSTLTGTNIITNLTGASYGTVLINLKNWSERKESVDDVMRILAERVSNIKDAEINFFPPAAIPGYGNAGGFEVCLVDKSGKTDLESLEKVLNNFTEKLNERPEIESIFSLFSNHYPQFMIDIDYDKAAKNGVSVSNAMSNLQILLGSEWATDFIRYGKTYRVLVQAHPRYRAIPDDLLKLFVKNKDGEMVPYSSFVKIEKFLGPEQITRFNMYTSAEMSGEVSHGYSSGDAMKAIKEVAKQNLPAGYDIEWVGMSYDEDAVGNTTFIILIICLVFVYLILSAQYESFIIPLSVILSLPVGLMGAFLFLWVLGLENNIYSQIAMIMLIGILSKNAILIVEYAIQKQQESLSLLDAIMEASLQRLQPIIMTSLAFIAGLLPLLFASGVGASGNRTIGAAAVGGMLFGTFVGVFFVPGLYYAVRTLFKKSNQ
jgi:HAE1 family hydrophobic/amphiphilic exporter-1